MYVDTYGPLRWSYLMGTTENNLCDDQQMLDFETPIGSATVGLFLQFFFYIRKCPSIEINYCHVIFTKNLSN